MNCALCNSQIIENKSIFVFKSIVLGEIVIPSITFDECSGCGDRILSKTESEFVIRYVRKKEMDAICKLPAGDLISADDAAMILGITKQAFSKNTKIKRGFIFSINVGKRALYFKSSVLKFKESGDGRIQLATSWGKAISLVHAIKKTKTNADWGADIESISHRIMKPLGAHNEARNGYATVA